MFAAGPTPAQEPHGVHADGADHSRRRTRTDGAERSQPLANRAPHQPAAPPGGRPGPSVAFARSGLIVPWHPDYGTLLELAEACDVPVRWSCRTGICHTCETALLSGHVEYAPQPLEPPPEEARSSAVRRPRPTWSWTCDRMRPWPRAPPPTARYASKAAGGAPGCAWSAQLPSVVAWEGGRNPAGRIGFAGHPAEAAPGVRPRGDFSHVKGASHRQRSHLLGVEGRHAACDRLLGRGVHQAGVG
ncbi:2Fe-2S iron-sulfur cluster-binding protein [Streptomyces sp. NPDC087532]|uniref:2Fe-2S iron-sulfur cluster-binding protein n=1 Tax=Streptomyces sp. NPDC087532 TaxID=3365795 RepID=UPI00380B8E25